MTDAERAARKAAKTHCVNDHELTVENTRTTAKGQKVCKICQRNSQQKHHGRAISGDKPVGPRNRDKTHCPQGHEYSDQNTALKADGSRSCKRCKRWIELKSAYGINEVQFSEMLGAQGGQCAICLHLFDLTIARDIHVDHCHDTGRVRELLCGRCNPGLGNFQDDSARMRRAADYLDRHAALNPSDLGT